jgi:hypothetical protein
MLQVVPRVWPADAVHDTVQAVASGPAFQRSLQSSIAERLLQWLGQWLSRLFGLLDGKTSPRAIALALAAGLVLLVVARLVLAAQARDAEAFAASRGGRATASEDPWRAAERLRAAGRYEEAAHALYRGVLTSVAQRERVRLDPSKTSGDYARELRARGSDLHPLFGAFSRRFDVAVYGYGGCDEGSLAELRRLADPFVPQARAA